MNPYGLVPFNPAGLRKEVVNEIAFYDPRFVCLTETGAIRLRDPETGVEEVLTHSEYIMLAEPRRTEVLFCSIDVLRATCDALPSKFAALVSERLTEIRSLLSDYVDEVKATKKMIADNPAIFSPAPPCECCNFPDDDDTDEL